MPGLNKILACPIGAQFVGDNDGVAGPAFWTAVQANSRRNARCTSKDFRRERAASGGNDQETGSAKRAKFRKVGSLLSGIVVGVTENEPMRVLEGHVFRAAHDTREERVGDVRNDHAENLGAIQAQTLSKGARLESKGTDRFQNAHAKLGSHRRSVVDNVGDSANGDLSTLRNLPHCNVGAHQLNWCSVEFKSAYSDR